MSKIIEASKKILAYQDETKLQLESIVKSIDNQRFEFVDNGSIVNRKELICGYTVYYSMSKIKAKSKSGHGDSTQIQVIIHGVFTPLNPERIYDVKIIDDIADSIKYKNL